MGSLFIILARALIVAPFLVGPVLAGFDYSAAREAFAEAFPQFAAGYPVILGAQVILGAIVVLGLPLHRIVAGVLAVLVVLFALWQSAFWNVGGSAGFIMQAEFLTALAHAGGLLLIAAIRHD